MVSRENWIVGAFVTVALAAFFLLGTFTDVDSTVLLGIVLFVGVVLPMLVNEHLRDETEA